MILFVYNLHNSAKHHDPLGALMAFGIVLLFVAVIAIINKRK